MNEPKLIPADKEEEKINRCLKKSVALKERLFEALPKDFPNPNIYKNFKHCADPRTLHCKDCGNMSLKDLGEIWFCNKRWCPICSRREAAQKANVISTGISDRIIHYRKKGIPLLPCLITLTMHRHPDYTLDALLNTIITAWILLRNGGDKAKVMDSKRKNQYDPWWFRYFIGTEIYSIEIPYERINDTGPFAYGVHMHIIALRKFEKFVPFGIDTKTGKIKNSDGLRSQWTYWLSKAWKIYMSEFEFPNEKDIATHADIHAFYDNNRNSLIAFFEQDKLDEQEIKDKVFHACQEGCKYILKGSHIGNLISEHRVVEFIKGIHGKHLSDVTGDFRKLGILDQIKRQIREERHQERMELEELKEKIHGEKKWIEGENCPVCEFGVVCYGRVHFADVKIAFTRAKKKFL